ncbi:precorrin-8X methylmutase [Lachnospiraceae bacterium XPB1003]|nr:precorrin-8X methylmutase [Lachnospiraceae bacterium XPB1003]
MDYRIIENLKPLEIEKRSFEMISEELADRGIVLPEEREMVIKRVIHASADFEYADTLSFSADAMAKAKSMLESGCIIVTDTNMALSGINHKTMDSLGCKGYCFMNDDDIAARSKLTGETRAALSMEHAAEVFKGKPVMIVSGNAPTALIKIRQMYDKGIYRPELVIGVPVGFVNVEVAKEMIMDTDIPYIVNRGRKGGSNIAAAIVNALMYRIHREV